MEVKTAENTELMKALDILSSKFETYAVGACPTPVGNDVIIINPEAEHFLEVQKIVEELPKKFHEQVSSTYVMLAWGRPLEIIAAGPQCHRLEKGDFALANDRTKTVATVILGGKYLVIPESAFSVTVNV